MNNKIVTKICIAITLLLVTQIGFAYITQVEEVVVQKVDYKAKTVVINGKVYDYNFDLKKSNYRFVDDVKKNISLRNIKEGESYFVQFLADGDNIRIENFDTIIFVSKTPPSE